MGKAYANRKSIDERPESDFYPTPGFLTRKLMTLQDFKGLTILEPAFGSGAISNILSSEFGLSVIEHDLRMDGVDFLTYKPSVLNEKFDMIITNPPFSLFDEFVMKSKELVKEFWLIGKTNFFAAHARNTSGLWKGLKEVYVFDRMVDYRHYYKDGSFDCGMLVTGWFHFDMNYQGKATIEPLDVQDGVHRGETK